MRKRREFIGMIDPKMHDLHDLGKEFASDTLDEKELSEVYEELLRHNNLKCLAAIRGHFHRAKKGEFADAAGDSINFLMNVSSIPIRLLLGMAEDAVEDGRTDFVKVLIKMYGHYRKYFNKEYDEKVEEIVAKIEKKDGKKNKKGEQ